MEYAKWYLEAHRGLSWKWNYAKIKTEKKLSEQLLCFLLNQLTELQLSPQEALPQDCFCGIWKWFLKAHGRLWWKRKYPKIKTEKKHSEKLLCVLLIHLTELQLPPQESFSKTVLVELAKWYLESLRGLWRKRKYPKIKTEKKLSEKLPCVLLIHLTGLQLSPQEAFR